MKVRYLSVVFVLGLMAASQVKAQDAVNSVPGNNTDPVVALAELKTALALLHTCEQHKLLRHCDALSTGYMSRARAAERNYRAALIASGQVTDSSGYDQR